MSHEALKRSNKIRGLRSADRNVVTAIAMLYQDRPTIMTRKQILLRMNCQSSKRTVDRALNRLDMAKLIRRHQPTAPTKKHLVEIEMLLDPDDKKSPTMGEQKQRQNPASKWRRNQRQNGATDIISNYSPSYSPNAEPPETETIDSRWERAVFDACCRILGKDPDYESARQPRQEFLKTVVNRARDEVRKLESRSSAA